VPTDQKKHSRREFARRAALLSVAAPLAGPGTLAASDFPSASDEQQLPKLPPDFPKLADQSRAEVDERYNAILNQYGTRLSAEQKADVRRLCFLAQPPLDNLRAYSIRNGDSPALYLKPAVEREKKPAAQTPKTPAPAAKKS
jgi:hypothetical protein